MISTVGPIVIIINSIIPAASNRHTHLLSKHGYNSLARNTESRWMDFEIDSLAGPNQSILRGVPVRSWTAHKECA